MHQRDEVSSCGEINSNSEVSMGAAYEPQVRMSKPVLWHARKQ